MKFCLVREIFSLIYFFPEILTWNRLFQKRKAWKQYFETLKDFMIDLNIRKILQVEKSHIQYFFRKFTSSIETIYDNFMKRFRKSVKFESSKRDRFLILRDSVQKWQKGRRRKCNISWFLYRGQKPSIQYIIWSNIQG